MEAVPGAHGIAVAVPLNERFVTVGAQQLAVVEDGPTHGEPLLLIMGLGLQLIAWPQALVDLWAARGFRVIRYDHRDIGRSSPQDHLPTPSLAWGAMRHFVGLPLPPPYTLAALADDAAGLLRALGINKAQVVGISMGGMVAQHLARRHPQLVSHLHLWMTTSGARLLPMPHRRLLGLMTRRPRTREAALQHYLLLFGALAGSGYRTPESELRLKVAAGAARAWRPQATLRQLLAIAADGDRSRWLRELRLPINVLHGSDDPMLPLPHAHHLVRQLHQGKLRVIEGWGHDLPQALLGELAQTVQRSSPTVEST